MTFHLGLKTTVTLRIVTLLLSITFVSFFLHDSIRTPRDEYKIYIYIYIYIYLNMKSSHYVV